MAKNLKMNYKSVIEDGRADRIAEFLERLIGTTEVEMVEEEDGNLGIHYNYSAEYKDRVLFIEYGANLILIGHDVDYALKNVFESISLANRNK